MRSVDAATVRVNVAAYRNDGIVCIGRRVGATFNVSRCFEHHRIPINQPGTADVLQGLRTGRAAGRIRAGEVGSRVALLDQSRPPLFRSY
jgi:hypothetical protein